MEKKQDQLEEWQAVVERQAASGKTIAAFCEEVSVVFEAWLNDILPWLDSCPAVEVRTLLPHIWKNAR